MMHKNPHPKTEINNVDEECMKNSREKIDNFTCRISWRVRYDNKFFNLENLLTIVERL